MDAATLRQRVRDLDHRRRQLIEDALRPLPMVGGYLFQMRRRCGNPRCRVAWGRLHISWYLARRHSGKTKLKHVGRVIPEWLTERVGRYRDHQKTLAAIRKIDREISGLLNRIRDDKLKSLEQELEERR